MCFVSVACFSVFYCCSPYSYGKFLIFSYTCTCSSCNMGTSDLSEKYVLALGLRPHAHAYISGKSQVPMLQLIYSTWVTHLQVYLYGTMWISIVDNVVKATRCCWEAQRKCIDVLYHMRISYDTHMVHTVRVAISTACVYLFYILFFAGSRTVCCFYHDFLCFCWTPGLGYLGPLATCRATHKGGQLGNFAPGPLTTYLKDLYTLIEQSALIKWSQYSSEEQCIQQAYK